MVTRYPEAIKEFPRSMQIVIKRVVNRVDGGKNALICWVGQTGSGKSLSALQFMRGIHMYMHGKPPEDQLMVDHTFFKAKPFVEQMQKISQGLVDGADRNTMAWIWDEAGIEAGHKEFMSVRNKIIGWLVQTFRNLRQIVIFTTPTLSFIDASVRKMMHFYFESVSIDKDKKICIVKPLIMQYNTRMDKIYYHNFTYPNKDGFMVEVDVIGVPKITNELEIKYETEKNKFTNTLNAGILATLNKMDAKDLKDSMGVVEVVKWTVRQEEIARLMIEEGIISPSEIGRRMELSPTTISQNQQWMSRKDKNIANLLRKMGLGGLGVPLPTAST